MLPGPVYIFLLIELIAVAYIDITQRKIANLWPVLNLFIFLLFIIFMQDVYRLEWNTFFYSIVFFSVGLALFALKIMGAGDSKYLFSFFLLVPVDYQESALLCLLYVTVLVGGVLFLINCWNERDKIVQAWKNKDIKMLKGIMGRKFAFAPVILLSWMWFGWIHREILF